jgi:hypothetical protein
MNRSLPLFACALLGVALVFTAIGAYADDTIKHPGDHPKYSVEIEPHGLWSWRHYYYAPNDGFGLGVRVSIPIVENGFVPSINNNVAISFGVDWVHYSGADCYYYGPPPNPQNPGPCYVLGDANYLFFPVAMQWNFFVAQRWSVFGEPGLAIYHGFFDYCYNVPPGTRCPSPTQTGIDFAFYAGGRFHFSDHATLTMRIGYPTFSVGVSFL